jgi:cell division protein FtsA
MLKKIKDRNKSFYCGLDIGAQNIKAGLVEFRDKNNIEVVGAYEARTHGLRDGVVSDLAELSECVAGTLQNLAKKTGINIKDLTLCAGGDIVKFRESNAALPIVERGTKEISAKDVKSVNAQARLLGTEIEEEILHDIPQKYSVDNTHMVLNPLGLHGRRIGVQSLLIAVDSLVLKNVIKAVNQAGYDVADIVFGSYVAAEICSSEKEKTDGVIVVDMGAAHTKVVIIKDKLPQFCALIDMGGENMTADISQALKVNFDLAEDIKKSYATAMPSQYYQNEEILVKNESVYLPVKKDIIYRAIQSDIESLIDGILDAINDSAIDAQTMSAIVVTGGMALMPGIIEQMSQRVSLPVKLGRVNFNGQMKYGNAAIFSSVWGAAYFTYLKNRQTSERHYRSAWELITGKLREFYQEYF